MIKVDLSHLIRRDIPDTRATLFKPELISWCKDNNISIMVYHKKPFVTKKGSWEKLSLYGDLYSNTNTSLVCSGSIDTVMRLASDGFYSWYFEFENPEHEMLFKLTWSK